MFGRIVHQQMYVVYLAVHLDHLSLKVATHLGEYDAKAVDGFLVKYLFPILCDEDQVDMELKNAVSTVSDCTRQEHRPSVNRNCTMSRRTFKYRLYPNRQQREQ